jgi:meso-butanediol dehydrogenase / (S,S)-butanediol dehydrogenase / diacetyl reductase
MTKASLITGATSGIGKEIAFELSRRGDMVGILGRRREHAEAVVNEIKHQGGNAIAIVADISIPEQVAAAASDFAAWAGKIDCVIANAGVSIPGKITDFSLDDWRTTMNVNLDGVFYTAKFCMPHLIASKGNLTIISSHGGVMGVAGYFSYSASKFATVGLGRSLAVDHAADGVRVNVICPGTIRTEMSDRNMPFDTEEKRLAAYAKLSPQKRVGTLSEVAKAVAYVSSDDAGYTNGAVLVIDGGSAAAFSLYSA